MSIATLPLLEALRDPEIYPHTTGHIDVLETHISWVILTGGKAYKIKKPVKNAFLDFSTLDRRFRYCQRELAINRAWAPDLYEEVVPIRAMPGGYSFGGDGRIVEYAIRMRQFAPGSLALDALHDERLRLDHFLSLADQLAELHRRAEVVATDAPWGLPGIVRDAAWENLEALTHLKEPSLGKPLKQLISWTDAEFSRCEDLFAGRRQQGFVRACHGDLHLGNLFLLDDRLRLFDGIEFNDAFRWIDTISDLAFLLMDLKDHGHADWANQVLNRYLEKTGDTRGLALLRWYLVYRALVRAKVAAIRGRQQSQSTRLPGDDLAEVQQYVRLAVHEIDPRAPVLMITHGVSGSGKSTGTARLLNCPNVVRLRSDVIRKQLHGDRVYHSTESTEGTPGSAAEKLNAGLYSSHATDQTYDALSEATDQLLRLGYSVIVDATFLEQARRTHFRALASTREVPFWIITFSAPTDELRQRIARRQSQGTDVSDANLEVLAYQQQHTDPLTVQERYLVRSLDEIERALQ